MFGKQRAAVLREVSGTAGPVALLAEAVDEVSSRRRLIRYLVQADMKKRGSDTFLGNLWWILDPLLQMVVYVVFVTILARRPAPDYPLFIFAAVLPWKWFSSVVTDANSSVVGQGSLIRQIAFPKIVLPIASATAGVVGFRDLGNVAGHVLRLWWFLSPSLYSLSALDNLGVVREHPVLRTIAGLNPFAVLFEAYRAVIYGTPDGGLPVPPNVVNLFQLLVASVVLVGLAAIFFKRVEPTFAKVL
jgi:ABC-type polysaccharide/polyol phosphate export permease